MSSFRVNAQLVIRQITGTHAVCFALSARFLSPLTPNFDHLRPKTNCSLRGDEPLLRRPSRLSSLPDPEPSAAAGRLAAENCAGGGGGGGIPGGSARRRRFDCATDEATDELILQSRREHTSAYALASRAFEALPDAVRAVHAATGQTQFPISLSLAREPEKEIEQWMQMVRGARERAEASAE